MNTEKYRNVKIFVFYQEKRIFLYDMKITLLIFLDVDDKLNLENSLGGGL